MKIKKGELTLVKIQSSKALSAAEALKITSKEELEKGVELLSKIKAVQKLNTNKKLSITRPINDGLKEVRDLFRPIENSISDAERIVKDKMLTYQEEVDREAKEKEAKIAARLRKGTMKVETAINKMEEIKNVDQTVKSNSGSAQFRVRRVVVVTNENKLPREYLEPNMQLIKKDALDGKEIPGVRVEERKEVAGFTK